MTTASPSPLKDRITDDMKSAMRARETDRLSTIRMLLAAIKQREVDERIVLDDAAVVGVVDKLVKQRRDSITAFRRGCRRPRSRRRSRRWSPISARRARPTWAA
jgi:uncharacterized protein YqeY